MRDPINIPALVERRAAYKSLEAPFYNSPEILDLDIEVIFGNHWIFVGTEPELPEPGDCITVEIGKVSVLLLRGDDEEIRGFHNVCRHRGAKLVDEKSTTIGNIVCRYHGWTYNEDGELILAWPEDSPCALHCGPDLYLSGQRRPDGYGPHGGNDGKIHRTA